MRWLWNQGMNYQLIILHIYEGRQSWNLMIIMSKRNLRWRSNFRLIEHIYIINWYKFWFKVPTNFIQQTVIQIFWFKLYFIYYNKLFNFKYNVLLILAIYITFDALFLHAFYVPFVWNIMKKIYLYYIFYQKN